MVERTIAEGLAVIRLARRAWNHFSMVRFFSASAAATVVDYALYIPLTQVLRPEVANICSTSTAILANFTLQRLVVFRNIRRTVLPSFLISVALSVVGMLLSTLIIFLIRLGYPEGVLIPKLTATALVFFWNYYSKKHLAFREGVPESSES